MELLTSQTHCQTLVECRNHRLVMLCRQTDRHRQRWTIHLWSVMRRLLWMAGNHYTYGIYAWGWSKYSLLSIIYWQLTSMRSLWVSCTQALEADQLIELSIGFFTVCSAILLRLFFCHSGGQSVCLSDAWYLWIGSWTGSVQTCYSLQTRLRSFLMTFLDHVTTTHAVAYCLSSSVRNVRLCCRG